MKPIIVTYSNESYWWFMEYLPQIGWFYLLPNTTTGIVSTVYESDIKLIARPKK